MQEEDGDEEEDQEEDEQDAEWRCLPGCGHESCEVFRVQAYMHRAFSVKVIQWLRVFRRARVEAKQVTTIMTRAQIYSVPMSDVTAVNGASGRLLECLRG